MKLLNRTIAPSFLRGHLFYRVLVPVTEENVREECDYTDAVLVSSLQENGMHKPALDIDLPVTLVPSTTEGHFHLYLDHEMTWDQYAELLVALRNANVINQGYYEMAMKRRATMLRKPGLSKFDTCAEPGYASSSSLPLS